MIRSAGQGPLCPGTLVCFIVWQAGSWRVRADAKCFLIPAVYFLRIGTKSLKEKSQLNSPLGYDNVSRIEQQTEKPAPVQMPTSAEGKQIVMRFCFLLFLRIYSKHHKRCRVRSEKHWIIIHQLICCGTNRYLLSRSAGLCPGAVFSAIVRSDTHAIKKNKLKKISSRALTSLTDCCIAIAKTQQGSRGEEERWLGSP